MTAQFRAMTAQFRPPPTYQPDDTSWPALLAFANQVAMGYRRALLKERAEHAARVAELIAELDRQKGGGT